MTDRDTGGDELPWDKAKPHPDDGDLFAQGETRRTGFVQIVSDDDRLQLARIAARPILEDPPPSA